MNVVAKPNPVSCSEAEWQARVDLAATFRILPITACRISQTAPSPPGCRTSPTITSFIRTACSGKRRGHRP